MAQLSLARSARRRACGVLLASLLAIGLAQSGVAQGFNEYQVKAVFLFNFAQFVDWSAAKGATDDAFVIGVLGEDPFGGYLDDTVRGESIAGRSFEVRRYRTVEEAARADILFVSRSERERLAQIVDRLDAHPVLTVSDVEDFARRGGMVQFVTENRRIKLNVNLDAARAAKLVISSKLLRPANIVSTEAR